MNAGLVFMGFLLK